MTTERKWIPVTKVRHGCDTCSLADFSGKQVKCLHPQRPDDKRAVVKWYTGCPQHKPKEQSNERT